MIRAQKRLEGAELFMSLINESNIMKSVQYYILLGWLGFIEKNPRYDFLLAVYCNILINN